MQLKEIHEIYDEIRGYENYIENPKYLYKMLENLELIILRKLEKKVTTYPENEIETLKSIMQFTCLDLPPFIAQVSIVDDEIHLKSVNSTDLYIITRGERNCIWSIRHEQKN